MKRREFIILGGIGATSASLLSACGHPEEKLIPAFIPDDEYVPGIDYWKASTCGMCPAGCGIIVRTREHKANKIEGNPLHPVNRGALCARGQAGLEVLYNPDRIKGPMKRVGERGEGKWEEITWAEGIKTLVDKLREIDPNSTDEKAIFATSDGKSITARVAARFMQAYRQVFAANRIDAEENGVDGLLGGVRTGDEIFDIGNATYLLSLGARFLENWKSPVMYSRAYGEFRSGRGKQRGRFVHIEPRMSLTAANADEWLPASAETEALVALAIAQTIVREGLNKAPLKADSAKALEPFSPEATAHITDIPADRIIRLAREFSKAERPLAIGGFLPSGSLSVNLLNALVDNLNRPGGVLLVERHEDESNSALELPERELILPPGQDESVLSLRIYQMTKWDYRLIMIHGINPIFAKTPWRWLPTSSFVVSFSSFIDETSDLADLVLPDHSYLERWDIHSSFGSDGAPIVSLTQPVLGPQRNSMQTSDVLLAVARSLGGEVARALDFESSKDIVEKSALSLVKKPASEIRDGLWSQLMELGIMVAKSSVPGSKQRAVGHTKEISLDRSALESFLNKPVGEPNAEYPLNLIVYEHATLGDGSAANLPSIQELPDSMTSVMWGSWVEINPKTASSLGVADGDLVEIATEQGSLRLPAVVYPGIRPDVVAMPFGQGHTKFGRYATNRGVSAEVLTSDFQRTVRARVSRVAGKADLIRFGTDLQETMEKKPWR